LLHPLAEAWVVRIIDQEEAATMKVTQKLVTVKVNVSGADGSHIKEVVFGWSGARPIILLGFRDVVWGLGMAACVSAHLLQCGMRDRPKRPRGERKSFRFVSIRRSKPKQVTH
jgi:hypothetical protein